MTNFSISVELETDIEPLSEDDIKDYIVSALESHNVLVVTNIVRDYWLYGFRTLAPHP